MQMVLGAGGGRLVCCCFEFVPLHPGDIDHVDSHVCLACNTEGTWMLYTPWANTCMQLTHKTHSSSGTGLDRLVRVLVGGRREGVQEQLLLTSWQESFLLC